MTDIASVLGAIGGVVGVIVSLYTAIKGARKNEMEVLRGIIAEQRASNKELSERVSKLEDEKNRCAESLSHALSELEKMRSALKRRGFVMAE